MSALHPYTQSSCIYSKCIFKAISTATRIQLSLTSCSDVQPWSNTKTRALGGESKIGECHAIALLIPALDIMKTCPCNMYPLELHFYTAKLGYAGVYPFFLFLLQNIDCGYSLEPPRRGGSNVCPRSMF